MYLKYHSNNWNSGAKYCITALHCSADKQRTLSRFRDEWSSIFSDYIYNSIKTKCKLPFTSFKKAQSWKVSLPLLRNSLTIRPNQEIDLSGTKNAFNLIRRLNLSKRECKIRHMHMNIDISYIKAKHLVHIFYSYINLDKTRTHTIPPITYFLALSRKSYPEWRI